MIASFGNAVTLFAPDSTRLLKHTWQQLVILIINMTMYLNSSVSTYFSPYQIDFSSTFFCFVCKGKANSLSHLKSWHIFFKYSKFCMQMLCVTISKKHIGISYIFSNVGVYFSYITTDGRINIYSRTDSTFFHSR